MPSDRKLINFSAPEEYLRAINAYAALNDIKRSEAIRSLIHDALVSHNLLDPDTPVSFKVGRPRKQNQQD
jgi:hypothetical protein